MKQLTCEMCGGVDLVKQDGMFICQTCGTKYSVEEAKKMMIEGTVDVSGSTIKVDNSASIENYFKMAENAYESSNQKEAESYCNKIIEIEPENYKAWLLKGKAAGWQSTLANIRIEESVNCFTKAVDNAPSDDVERVKQEASKEVESLCTSLIKLCCDNYMRFPSNDNAASIMNNLKLVQLYAIVLLLKCGTKGDGFKISVATLVNNATMNAWNNKIWNDYQGDGHPSSYDLSRFIEQATYAEMLIKTAIDLCDNDDEADKVRYQNLIAIHTKLMNACSYTYMNGGYVKEKSFVQSKKVEMIDEIMGWHQKIKDIDPSYVIPARPTPTANSGGCYVATAVYGSYDCPEVWTLRRYRDYGLAETWYGRVFIHVYYAISPTLVKWFGNTDWFKKIWRGKLDRMVKNLQDNGYESTPYEDKQW